MYFDITNQYEIEKDGIIKVYLKHTINDNTNNCQINIDVKNPDNDSTSSYRFYSSNLQNDMATINVSKGDIVITTCYNSNQYLIPEEASYFITLFEESYEDIEYKEYNVVLQYNYTYLISGSGDKKYHPVKGFLFIDGVYYYIPKGISLVFKYVTQKYNTKIHFSNSNIAYIYIDNNTDVDNIKFISLDRTMVKNIKILDTDIYGNKYNYV